MACPSDHKRMDVGGGCFIDGGSCAFPRVKDADLYVGFQLPLYQTSALSIPYPIEDFCAPAHPPSFKTLVGMVSGFLRPDRKVHVGCAGGHGRTGTFLAALVAYRRDLGIAGMAGIADPIDHVWRNYCDWAIESEAQFGFLAQHFGCPLYQQGTRTLCKPP